ncbi:MAG: hypothetical protein ACR2FO_01110 [Actinomycetota bacterium]
MTHTADFNLEDEKGRIPIVLESMATLHVGETLMVEDTEGNRCKAWVAEVTEAADGTHKLVAFVVPKPGTWERTGP